MGTGGPDLLPEKSQYYRVSEQYWPESPEKSQSYQASIQCWAIIGPPAKRHLNDDPLIVVFGSSDQTKKREKKSQNCTPSDKTFWIRTRTVSLIRFFGVPTTYVLVEK